MEGRGRTLSQLSVQITAPLSRSTGNYMVTGKVMELEFQPNINAQDIERLSCTSDNSLTTFAFCSELQSSQEDMFDTKM